MIKNDLLLRALKGEVVERPPVWMMRLHDASVAQSRRAGRAKALLYLGKMFQETKSTDPKAKDAAAVLEDALRAAFEPERGADDA